MFGHQFKNGKTIQHLVTNQSVLHETLPEFEFYHLHKMIEKAHASTNQVSGYIVVDSDEPYIDEIMEIIERYENMGRTERR